SFEKLLANIDDKQARLLARGHQHPGMCLGQYLEDVEAGLADLQKREVIARIWWGDHTVWKPDPTEIANRLGWLTVTDVMCEQVPVLQELAREVRDAGFRHVVLLGMGGSSLGPEVIRQTFGSEERLLRPIAAATSSVFTAKLMKPAIVAGSSIWGHSSVALVL
ncbi:MAG: hypothetical protein IIA90_02155, partial [Chloroflexi bacterium]|nr:hypothetical protein [Chloroflexota bacterium]